MHSLPFVLKALVKLSWLLSRAYCGSTRQRCHALDELTYSSCLSFGLAVSPKWNFKTLYLQNCTHCRKTSYSRTSLIRFPRLLHSYIHERQSRLTHIGTCTSSVWVWLTSPDSLRFLRALHYLCTSWQSDFFFGTWLPRLGSWSSNSCGVKLYHSTNTCLLSCAWRNSLGQCCCILISWFTASELVPLSWLFYASSLTLSVLDVMTDAHEFVQRDVGLSDIARTPGKT